MAGATDAVWHWFFPKERYLPDCVRKLLEFVYPDVDWDRVSFHEGWPHVTGASDKKGLTLPHSFIPGRVRVYIKEGEWDPCTCDGLGLIVHEGFHVLQIQNIFDGYGLGLANPTTMLYLACWADNGFDYDGHPAENAAYRVAGRSTSIFDSCCQMQGSRPCDCRCDPPTLDQAELDDFEQNCSKVVQRSNGTGFWTQLGRCTPGFEALVDAAKSFFNGTCGSDASWGIRWLPCIFGAIAAGLLFAIAGIWYAIWFLITLVASIVLLILDLVVNIVGAVVGGVVAVGEAIWDAITSPFSEVEGNLWYTTYDGTEFDVPDLSITQNGRSRTKRSPGAAVFQSELYTAYKSRDSDDIWYNVFDGSDWLAVDRKITKDGRTRTGTDPALCPYNNQLYMAYRASGSDHIWDNVFDGSDWLDADIEITKDGKTRTSHSPSLAQFQNQLYMAYKASGGDHIWYNVFDGSNWLDDDIEITKNDKTRTSDSPSLAAYNGELYMAYRSASNDHIWYNVFDGSDWLDEDIEISADDWTRTSIGPSLAAFDNRLFLIYKSSSDDNIWYNVFDGNSWLEQDCRITRDDHIRTGTRPAAAEFNGLLYVAYRGAG